jgi:uncharacterized protein YkwD
LFATPLTPSGLDETRATLRGHVLKLINRDRALYNLPPVKLDLHATAMGDEYCRTQIRNGTTGHFTIDGVPPYARYSFAGGNDAVSENAAAWSANYRFSERALYEMVRRSQDAMMAEMPPHDGHKRTILDPHATHVGIGMAWERGEFRLVQEFIRRYVEWARPLPRNAHVDDVVMLNGRPIAGAKIEGITVHHEPLPRPMTVAAVNALMTYNLPEQRKEYLPRLRTEYTKSANGTIDIIRREYADGRKGDFPIAKDGSFSFTVPFTEGPGLYTVVVWVRKDGVSSPVSVSNASLRVEGTSRTLTRASALRSRD